jgi:4-amino-4-deoxy-L-arabinose transferase-like glycosyltransferase
MSSRESVRPAARGLSKGGAASARAAGRPAAGFSAAAVREAAARMSGYGWAAIGATAVYIALTCWWLTKDRSIPIYDAGDHLETALQFHQMIAGGDLLGPLNHESPYPPFGPLVGAIGVFFGGVNVASPIIAENLVFVSLFTLGCYRTGRLLFGAKAGLMAALFVLGSALLAAQFHVFMLDPQEAAVVALSMWLLLECDDFSRVGLSGAAGAAVGLGAVTKVQYPGFVVGLLAIMLLRGAWRNRRGMLAFAGAAAVVGVPWYLNHIAQFSTFVQVSTANPIVVQGDIPPLLSWENFSWYFWNMLNSQMMVGLFLLFVGGAVWTATTLVRRRREAWGAKLGTESTMGARLEFFVGAVVGWVWITITPSHDIRYALPLLPYLAVLATGWIVYLPRAARWAAIAVLVVGVAANTLGTTFGVGKTVQLTLANPLPPGEEFADTVTFYSTAGFLVAAPQRDGDVPGLLEALHRNGVNTVAWSARQSREPDFNTEGLLPLVRIAGLTPVLTREPEYANSSGTATLIHTPVTAGTPPTCTKLSDGTGVWVVRFNPARGTTELYCPYRSPRFYGPQ